MKKINFILPMVAILIMTACSPNKNKTVDSRGVTDWRFLPNFYLQGHDSIYQCPQDFVLAKKTYTKCDGTTGTYISYIPNDKAEFNTGGKFTMQGKQIDPDSLLTLLGVPPGSQIVLPKTNETVGSADSVNDTETSTADTSGISLGWLWSLLKILFALAVIAVALWGLYRLINWLLENLGGKSNSNPSNNNGNSEQPVHRVEVTNFPVLSAPMVQAQTPAITEQPSKVVEQPINSTVVPPATQNVASVIVVPQEKLVTRKVTIEETYIQPSTVG
jgi:hypothetical protein